MKRIFGWSNPGTGTLGREIRCIPRQLGFLNRCSIPYLGHYLSNTGSLIDTARIFYTNLRMKEGSVEIAKYEGKNTGVIPAILFEKITDPKGRLQIAKMASEINCEQRFEQLENYKLSPLDTLEILYNITANESLQRLILHCKNILQSSADSQSIQQEQVIWLTRCVRNALGNPDILKRISAIQFSPLLTEIFCLKSTSDREKFTQLFLNLSQDQAKNLQELIEDKAPHQIIPALNFISANLEMEIAQKWVAVLQPNFPLLEHPLHTHFHTLTKIAADYIKTAREPLFFGRHRYIAFYSGQLDRALLDLKTKIPHPYLEEFFIMLLCEVHRSHGDYLEEDNFNFILRFLLITDDISLKLRLMKQIFQLKLGDGVIKNILLAFTDLSSLPSSSPPFDWKSHFSELNPAHKFELITYLTSNDKFLSSIRIFVLRCKEIILKKTLNPINQNLQCRWILTCIDSFTKIQDDTVPNIPKSNWLDLEFAPLLDEICLLRRDSIRTDITATLVRFNEEMLNELKNMMKNLSPHLLLIAYYFSLHRIDPVFARDCISCLQPKFYKNGLIIAPLIEVLSLLDKDKTGFSTKEIEDIISFIIRAPKKIKGQKEEEFKRELDTFRKQQKSAINTILYFLRSENFSDLKNFDNSFAVLLKRQKESFNRMFFGTAFTTAFTNEEIDRFTEKFQMTARYPGGLFVYASQLHTLSEEEMKRSLELLNNLITFFIQGNFTEYRYDLKQSKHLETLFSQNLTLYQLWKQPISPIEAHIAMDKIPVQIKEAEGFYVQDSDDFEDLLLSGTEVAGSCQNIFGTPFLNKCLLAVISDGKIKIMVVKDRTGRIVARANLRILQDEVTKKPVLFVDRVYAILDRNFETAIYTGCVAKAKQMGIALASSWLPPNQEEKRYPGSLESLSGKTYEYVDRIGGIRGGEYILSSLWSLRDELSD